MPDLTNPPTNDDTPTNPAPDRLYLNCPFKDKDEVKALGATFDNSKKMWWIPIDADPMLYCKWIQYDPTCCDDDPDSNAAELTNKPTHPTVHNPPLPLATNTCNTQHCMQLCRNPSYVSNMLYMTIRARMVANCCPSCALKLQVPDSNYNLAHLDRSRWPLLKWADLNYMLKGRHVLLPEPSQAYAQLTVPTPKLTTPYRNNSCFRILERLFAIHTHVRISDLYDKGKATLKTVVYAGHPVPKTLLPPLSIAPPAAANIAKAHFNRLHTSSTAPPVPYYYTDAFFSGFTLVNNGCLVEVFGYTNHLPVWWTSRQCDDNAFLVRAMWEENLLSYTGPSYIRPDLEIRCISMHMPTIPATHKLPTRPLQTANATPADSCLCCNGGYHLRVRWAEPRRNFVPELEARMYRSSWLCCNKLRVNHSSLLPDEYALLTPVERKAARLGVHATHAAAPKPRQYEAISNSTTVGDPLARTANLVGAVVSSWFHMPEVDGIANEKIVTGTIIEVLYYLTDIKYLVEWAVALIDGVNRFGSVSQQQPTPHTEHGGDQPKHTEYLRRTELCYITPPATVPTNIGAYSATHANTDDDPDFRRPPTDPANLQMHPWTKDDSKCTPGCSTCAKFTLGKNNCRTICYCYCCDCHPHPANLLASGQNPAPDLAATNPNKTSTPTTQAPALAPAPALPPTPAHAPRQPALPATSPSTPANQLPCPSPSYLPTPAPHPSLNMPPTFTPATRLAMPNPGTDNDHTDLPCYFPALTPTTAHTAATRPTATANNKQQNHTHNTKVVYRE
jgi:hypothetical protein